MSATVFAPAEAPAVVDALQAHLRTLGDLIRTLPAEAYRDSPSPASGSIGEHVRHCLNHARALLASASDGELTYDARHRGTRVEVEPELAAGECERLCLDLQQLDNTTLERPIRLHTLTHRDMSPTRVGTTLGREIVFVIQHTIHHCAVIAVLLDRVGITVPRDFGYAPSTPSRR
jgi:uncharacterized damage-inducible protein DinB